jgi:putative redox protein
MPSGMTLTGAEKIMEVNVQFQNRRGQTLSGVLHQPDRGVLKAYALFAHCFTCTKNIRAAVNIAEAMAQEGIAVLRFDFTGLGASEGEFAETHFSSNVDDLEDAARYLAKSHQAPSVLVGHSLGGTAVLAVAPRIESAVAVATIGSPADADHVLHLFGDELERIEAEGEVTVKLAGRPFRVRRDFVEDVREQKVRKNLRALRKPLLIMHSPVDDLVSIEQASNLFVNALHPKSFISLDKADHLLSRAEDSRYAGQVLSAWAARYLSSTAETNSYPAPEAGAVVVSSDTEDMFLTTINADGHGMLADEPAAYGGSEQGPTPYGLLSAALGACTSMTINMYARRKKIALKNVTVATRHDKIHAVDCEECESETGRIDRFERVVTLTGDLSEDERQALLVIADKCPVHRTLHSEISVVTRLQPNQS